MTINIYNMADTWNAVGTTFNGIYMNFTNGAAGAPVGAAGSRFLRLDNNGTSVFDVDANGLLRITGAGRATIFSFDAFNFQGSSGVPGNAMIFNTGATGIWYYDANGLVAANGKYIGFNSSAAGVNAGPELILNFDATNTFGLRNGVNAQKLNVYNTFASLTSSYERFYVDWTQFTNMVCVGMSAGSSAGTARQVLYQSNPVTLASLPTPASVGSGCRAYISDSTAPAFNVTASGGGTTPMVVWSNGANWKCG